MTVSPGTSTVDQKPWWRSAAIYQVYPRSFADANGDGIGDLAGVRARLPYLRDLGVDAIWFSPWYPSPMADAGYDVADYRDIDPVFGTLAEAEALIAEAHALGLRVIIDLVPNHCSSRHPWFLQALAAGRNSADRELFYFRDGRGAHGELPPNNWQSNFGGPAWTRVPDGQWYLHLFDAGQPDLNWANPRVRREFEAILRFWFDKGVDGLRIDAIAGAAKDPLLPDFDPENPPFPHPYTDRDELHDILRDWRKVADEYPDRVLVGEVWLRDSSRLYRYLRPDELHTAFNFDYLMSPWDAASLRSVIDATLASHAPVGAPATWVLSNHDVVRHVTRYGRADTSFGHGFRQVAAPADLALGTRRARAATLLSLALPGSVYLYQGEELGLWEVEDIPAELRQDPVFRRTDGRALGRDGCRVPLPWSGSAPPFGFSPDGAAAPPWLPQPAGWREYTVEAESADEGSMLSLYRAALAIRRAQPSFVDTAMGWLPAPEGVLAFSRGEGVICVVNLSPGPVPLPEHASVLLTSGPLADGQLPTDTAAWLTPAP